MKGGQEGGEPDHPLPPARLMLLADQVRPEPFVTGGGDSVIAW